MNSRLPMHILYVNFNDISAPKGPSVNEREFLNSLQGCSVSYTAVIPEPATRTVEASFQNVRTVSRLSSSRLHQIFIGQFSVLCAVTSLLYRGRNANLYIVIRLPALPWSIALLALIFPNSPMHIKSLGDTDFLKRVSGLKGLLLTPVAFLQSWQVRFVLKRTRTIDTVTGKLADRIARINRLDPSKIYVIPNTTNTNRFHPIVRHDSEPSKTRFVVGYVGGLPFTRGGRQIIQAISRLSDVIPGLRCRIAGGDVQDLERIAREKGIEDRCDIVGKIPYDSVNDFLNSLDVLFATDDSSRANMLGNSNQKIRQALSVGIPVISNPEVEQDFVRHDLVHIVDTDDIGDVCNAIFVKYELDANRREAFSKRARNFIRDNYSLEVSIARRLEIWTGENSAHTSSPKDESTDS